MSIAFIGLQIFVVLFLALHDWVPLGRLNDVRAVQSADSRGKLVTVTALSTLPFAICLAGSLYFARTRYPGWLVWTLWLGYGALAFGAFRAWWLPYLFVDEPVRAARYQKMFGRTHAFLPERHGIRPNTLHIVLHLAIAAVLILLARLT